MNSIEDRLDPVESSRSYLGCAGLCALTMGDQQSLGIPTEYLVSRFAGRAAPNEARLELGSNQTNPMRRLQDIHAHAADVKHEFAAMTPETAEVYTVLMQSIAQLGDSVGAGSIMPPLGNVVISNLIGPRKQLYLCGAPLLATYPISTIAPGLALNITMFTYRDTLHVGIVAGHSAIPDLEPIAANLRSALDKLETAMGLAPKKKRPRKKKPAR